MKNKSFIASSFDLIKSRKEMVFVVTYSATLGTVIAGKGFPPITKSILVISSLLMLNLSVYIYNDIIDRDMDSYSNQDKKKGRPIAHGVVSEKNAIKFVYITGLLGLALSFLINISVFIFELIYYIILLLYSYPGVRFKNMYIVKNLVTSLVLPTPYLISGVAIENRVSLSTLLIAISYFILTFAMLPAAADMLDYEEDLAFKVKTLGNTLSWKQNILLFNFGIIVIIASGIIAYRLLNTSYVVPVILTIIGIPSMIYSYKIRNESGISASYKLRPFGYILSMSTPLIIAISTYF